MLSTHSFRSNDARLSSEGTKWPNALHQPADSDRLARRPSFVLPKIVHYPRFEARARFKRFSFFWPLLQNNISFHLSVCQATLLSQCRLVFTRAVEPRGFQGNVSDPSRVPLSAYISMAECKVPAEIAILLLLLFSRTDQARS